jgi:hypothetical protein
MSVWLAMSCLQGRTQEAAFNDLCALGPDGVQLTPGNLPSPGFAERLSSTSTLTALHHGYSVDALRVPVWSKDGALLVSAEGRSVHPPMTRDEVSPRWLDHAKANDVIVEVMYPGYPLSGDDDVVRALKSGVRLAVDVSHLYLQRCAGVLSPGVERRLLDSDRVVEVHVSDNDGVKDSHTALTAGCYFLGWARERSRAGVPVVLESYFHRASHDERQRQLDLLRDA